MTGTSMPSCRAERARRLAAAFAAATLMLAVPAHAAPPEEEAKQHMKAAGKAYAEEDFDTAAREAEQAYELDPKPVYLYPWAQSERARGNCRKALELYRKFLESDPSKKAAADAKDNIVRCLEDLESEPEPEDPDGELPGDGGEEGSEGGEQPDPIEEQDPEGPDIGVVPDDGGDDSSDAWKRDVVGWTLVGAGGASLIAGGVLIAVSRIQAASPSAEDHAGFDSLESRLNVLQGVGIGLASLGVGLAVGGAVKLVLAGKQDDSGTVALGLNMADGPGLTLSGRF